MAFMILLDASILDHVHELAGKLFPFLLVREENAIKQRDSLMDQGLNEIEALRTT